MKKVMFLLVLCFVNIAGFGQEPNTDKKTDKITYSEIVTVDGISKETLYKNVLEWIYQTPNNSGNKIMDYIVIDEYKFPLKGYFYIDLYGDSKKISYNLTIEIKDNKYKYEFTNFFFEEVTSLDNYPKFYIGKKKVLEKTKTKVDQIINQLKKGLSNKRTNITW